MRFALLCFALSALVCSGVVVPMEIIKDNDAVIFSSNASYVVLGPERNVGDYNTFEWCSDPDVKEITILDKAGFEYIVWLSMLATADSPFDPFTLEPVQWLKGITSPTSITDVTTNATSALIVGSPCATFDGTATYTKFAKSIPGGDFTIEAFLKPNLPADARTFYSTTGTGSVEQIYFRVGPVSAPYIDIYIKGVRAYTGNALINNSWNHIAATLSGTNLNIYANGTNISFTGGPTSAPTNSTTQWIGCRIGNQSFYNGQIAYIKTWTNALSSNDIQVLNTGGDVAGHYFNIPYVSLTSDKVYSVSEPAIGTNTTGAGGLAAFWGNTQDQVHYCAENGGSRVMTFDAAGESLSSDSSTSGPQTLKVSVSPKVDASMQILDVGGETLNFDRFAANQFYVYYNGTNTGVEVDLNQWAVVEIPVNVGTLGAYISVGGVTSNQNFEIGYLDVTGNGGWNAAGYNADTGYVLNTDRTKNPMLVNGVSFGKQYPALASGTNDVAGAGLLNKPLGTNYVHNGMSYGLRQDYAPYSAVFTPSQSINTGITTAPSGTVYRFSVDYKSSNGSLGTIKQLLIDNSADLADPNGVSLRFANLNQPSIYIRKNGTNLNASVNGISASVYASKFYKFEGVFDSSSGSVAFYLDGVLKSSATNSAFIGFNPLIASPTRSLHIAGPIVAPAGMIARSVVSIDGTNYVDCYFNATNGTNVVNYGTVTNASFNISGITNQTQFWNKTVAGNLDLVRNGFWDHWSTKSYLDFYQHKSFSNNVVLRYAKPSPVCHLSDALTWGTNYQWTVTAYDGMTSWNAGTCGAGNKEPLKDINDEYITDLNGNLIFTED